MNPNIRLSILISLLTALSACGGGGGGGGSSAGIDGGGIGGTGIVSTGVMTKGSVIVNGVKFDDTNADIVIDDTAKNAIDLKDGMVVKVLGTIDDDGINGTAERVEAEIEVRGSVTSKHVNTQTFTVLGQAVVVDDQTIYSNISGFDSIFANPDGQSGTLVEVHGQRDTFGNIRATRVEANTLQMGDSDVDEIRGVVSERADNTDSIFKVGSQVVNATTADTLPIGATFGDGDIVEVHCIRPCINDSSQFFASLIEVEDQEDSAFNPGAGQRLEVEGLTSGVASPTDNEFFVAGISVTRNGNTRYEGGIDGDLKDNIKVEAEGAWDGSTLVASKIQFKRSVVRIQGAPRDPLDGTFIVSIANNIGTITVETDALTELKDGSLPDSADTCIAVRGQQKSGSTVIAGEIELDCSGDSGTRHLIQAPVEKEDGSILTLLGLDINVGAATAGYRDIDESPVLLDQFLSIVTPSGQNAANVPVSGTLVKVTFEGNSVKEAEIED